MSFMETIASAIAEAAEYTDMNEAQRGGGGPRRIPEAGLVRLRFITYIELGKHEDTFKGEVKRKDKVTLQFELSGPKHAPTVMDDGRVMPMIITINENLSLNEKANFFKLFKRMNHTGKHKLFAEMLGKEFLGEVVLVKKGEGAEAKTYANLRNDGGYTIRPPYHENLEGESVKVEVQPALTPVKCFLWDTANPVALKAMWDSLFIDGMWDDRKDDKGNIVEAGRSKNYYQNHIKAALDFAGSPIADLLFAEGGDPLDLGGAEKPARSDEDQQATADEKAGARDPLEGVA